MTEKYFQLFREKYGSSYKSEFNEMTRLTEGRLEHIVTRLNGKRILWCSLERGPLFEHWRWGKIEGPEAIREFELCADLNLLHAKISDL